MKRCPKCGETKPLDAFRVRATGKPQSYCKACDNLRAAAWAQCNRDRAKQHSVSYQQRNREALNERARALRAERPEEARAAVAKWRKSNEDKARGASRRWYAANPSKARAQEAKRRAVKAKAVPIWADLATIQDVYSQANMLRKLGLDVHVDHEIPLQGELVCGLHVANNLRIILASENIAKHNKFEVAA